MSLRTRFDEMSAKYREDHQHPVNRALHIVGVPCVIISIPLMLVDFRIGVALFVFAWTLQFVGHFVEGKPPTFLGDPRFLFVGAAVFTEKLRGVRRDDEEAVRLTEPLAE